MKRFGFISTAILFLILGLAGSVFAQQDERDKPPTHEDQAAPPQENREPDAKPAQQDEKPMQQDEKKAQQEQTKDDKQAQDQEKQQQKDEKRAQQEDKNNSQVKNAHAATNNAGGRIPDDKFRAHFGSGHHFRISHPTIVSGQPRFQYGGYWFVIATPWPVGWDYADDCYIDYVDGEYLLYDLAHPGASIVVSVVL